MRNEPEDAGLSCTSDLFDDVWLIIRVTTAGSKKLATDHLVEVDKLEDVGEVGPRILAT